MRRIHFAFTALFALAALGVLSPQRLEGQRASRFDREILNGREVVILSIRPQGLFTKGVR